MLIRCSVFAIKSIVLVFLFSELVFAAPSLSPRTYNKLTELQESIQALDEVKTSDQADYAKQVQSLNETLVEMADDLAGSPLGLALTLQTHAQLKLKQDQTKPAIVLLQRAVTIKEVDEATQNQLRMFLAQLLFSDEQYQASVDVLLPWLSDKSDKKPAAAYAMLAAGYYSLSDLAKGLPFIEVAVKLSATPKEPWLQMAFSGNYQQKEYERALEYLNLLVFNFPNKKDYWHQKAGVLQMLERYEEAAAVKELAFKRGFIKTEAEYINLGQLLASQGAAYKVAGILAEAMQSKQVEPSEKLLRLTQQAWMQAKAMDEAKQTLAMLFELVGEVDDALRLVQLHIDAEEWAASLNVIKQLETRELNDKQLAQTYLYKGIALYRSSSSLESALAAFAQAAKQKETAQQARAWMNYIKMVSDV